MERTIYMIRRTSLGLELLCTTKNCSRLETSYLTVSARAALVIPCEWEPLGLLVKSSIDLSAGFPLSDRVPPFSTLSTSNLKSSYEIHMVINNLIVRASSVSERDFHTLLVLTRRRFVHGIGIPPEYPNLCSPR